MSLAAGCCRRRRSLRAHRTASGSAAAADMPTLLVGSRAAPPCAGGIRPPASIGRATP